GLSGRGQLAFHQVWTCCHCSVCCLPAGAISVLFHLSVLQRLGWQLDCSLPIAAYRVLVLPVALALAWAARACCRSRAACCAYPFAVRTFVFAMPLSMACPIMLESLFFDLRARNPTLFVYFYRRYFWLLVAAFFNVSKIPERIQPGLFDIVGHSHQLFHIFTFLSIYDQVHYVEDGLAEYPPLHSACA
uniref:Progestin and adipoQ receptor family member 9 n=1 Tax=Serinus canaria TaxID=9135 RepID=A0A8C9KV38_SERCA